jgi:hypothetical protein
LFQAVCFELLFESPAISFCHCEKRIRLMAQGISAGILGNLNFEPYQHTWALELGNFLACYELLFNIPESESTPSNVAQRGEVVHDINSRLLSHGISYNVPNIKERRLVNNVVNQTLDNVKGLTSPAHCAFVLIGEAACFLREGVREASSEELKTAVRGVAQNRIRDVQNRCSGITLDCDAFWEILSSRSPEALTTQAMHQLFNMLKQPLKILILSADPQDQVYLRLGEERRELGQALQSTRFRDAFTINDLPSCRVRDISQALDQHAPNILHFSGHGNSSGLCFEGDDGNAQIISGQSLADLLEEQEGLKLVIMNACYSEAQAQPMADVVGYVIAMEKAIKDRDAITFSREFYIAIGNGRPIEAAFRRAKAAAQLQATSTLKAILLKRQSALMMP